MASGLKGLSGKNVAGRRKERRMASPGRKRHEMTLLKLWADGSIGIDDWSGVFGMPQRATSGADFFGAKIFVHFLSKCPEFTHDFRVFLRQIRGFTHVVVEIEELRSRCGLWSGLFSILLRGFAFASRFAHRKMEFPWSHPDGFQFQSL